MIVEQLFTSSDAMATTKTTNPIVPNFSCDFMVLEENAIYYTCGYVIKKLLHKCKSCSGEATEHLVKAALSLLGDNQDCMETHDTYLDYFKVWTATTDRGGLKHVSDETFRF